MVNLKLNDDEIVISGISGRFPESDNVAEFEHHLMNGIDMVTEDDRRWPVGFADLPTRSGKLKNIEKFDASAFGIPPKQVNSMDPQNRILLEVVYEAFMDSGFAPSYFHGSRTGVYVGISGTETSVVHKDYIETADGYGLIGTDPCMTANRVSYTFGLNGPSFPVNTACSSSLLALQLAYEHMSLGYCDAAVVCGCHQNLLPIAALHTRRLNMTAKDGYLRSLDASGQGYVRAETVAAVLLQKKSTAKRIYGTVVHVMSNSDGYKSQGITFPSNEMQVKLLREFYGQIDIDPLSVAYVEAHATGTPIGDPQEANGIDEVFCTGRQGSLLIGSVKSNMGHPEPSAGVCQIAKIVIAMERGVIPPNLHYKNPNKYIPALTEGRLNVVVDPTTWNGGLAAVNSFGFGGSNVHALLRSNGEIHHSTVKAPFPRLFCYSGRTEEAVRHGLNFIAQHAQDYYAYCLLSDASIGSNINMPYRGYSVLMQDGSVKDFVQQTDQSISSSTSRPIWFIYSGMGSQWKGMGTELLRLEAFRKSIDECTQVMRPFGVDIVGLLTEDTLNFGESVLNTMVGICAVQIALTDVLREVGIIPDGLIGHSFGEIACGYADGCLTLQECIKIAYWRGKIIEKRKTIEGAMAAVGLTWNNAATMCPSGVFPACYNAADSVTISGEHALVKDFLNELRSCGVFVKEVDSCGVAFHTSYLQDVAEELSVQMRTVIPDSKARSNRWVSTSVSTHVDNSLSSMDQLASPEYFANNLIAPVMFYDAMKSIPPNAVIIEVAPHALLQAVIKRCVNSPNAITMGLCNRAASDNLVYFTESLGKAHLAGLNVNSRRLYPDIQYPVPRGTPMLSPVMKWNHSASWTVVTYKDLESGGSGASVSFTIDPYSTEKQDDKFLLDHVVDSRPLFPMMGYVVLAWKALCQLRGLQYQNTPVLIEDVQLFRATVLNEKVKFDIFMQPGDPEFKIYEKSNMVAKGKVKIVSDNTQFSYDSLSGEKCSDERPCQKTKLDMADIYKQIRLRGYDYGPAFRSIFDSCSCGHDAKILWRDEWISFMDGMSQTALLRSREYSHLLPVKLRYMRIDPERHYAAIQEENDDGQRFVRCISDYATNGMIAGGIEFKDLIVTVTPRRMPKSQTVVYEKKQFVPYFDDNCFEDDPELRKSLSDYLQLMETIAASLDAGGDIQKALSGIPDVVQALEAFVLKNKETAAIAEILLLIQKEGSACDETELETLKKRIPDDMLVNCMWRARPLMPLAFLCLENQVGKKPKVVEIEPTNYRFITQVLRWINISPQTGGQGSILASRENIQSMESKYGPFAGDTSVLNVVDGKTIMSKEYENGCEIVVLHHYLSTKTDPVQLLSCVQSMLTSEGFLLVSEITGHHDVHNLINRISSGDKEKRIINRCSQSQWCDIFEKAGLQICAWQRDRTLAYVTSFLLRSKPTSPPQPLIVDVDDVDEFTWLGKAQEALRKLEGQDKSKTICLVARWTYNGVRGFSLCLKDESKFPLRTRFVHDQRSMGDRSKALSTADIQERLMKHDMFENIYMDNTWGYYAFVPCKEDDPVVMKDCQKAFMEQTQRGNLNSMKWWQSDVELFADNKSLWHFSFIKGKHTPKEYAVYYTAFNFRDIMIATGRLRTESMPGKFFKSEDGIGLLCLEFSGRDIQTGQRIMGVFARKCLATTVITFEELCVEIPDHWTMAEGATILNCYKTAYYSLVIRGGLRRGERILIHAGSGGVGQAAIRIALSLNCEVFTTVGTDTKRQFILETFPQIKSDHIGNSRSTDFEQMVRRLTDGTGVDVVLNSLAEDKLQAGIRCLAQNGRFIEIGKYDLMLDNTLGMSLFLRNINFIGIVLEMIYEDMEICKEVYDCVRDGIKTGVVQPLRTNIFAADDCESALRFMAKGNHIGKVLIKIREEEQDKVVMPKDITVRAIVRPFCYPKKVYIITGGLGGLGLELAEWLVLKKARKIVLTSRSGIRTMYQKRAIDAWTAKGVDVRVMTHDLSDKEEARTFVEECIQIGSIDGIFHLAMVLRDALVDNQTVDNFKESSLTKYKTTLNLDFWSRQLCGKDMRWFVGFSSIASGKGHKGQTCYGWSNSIMETIIDHRRRSGYSGTVIEWGAVGDVGVILDGGGTNQTVVGGTIPQRIYSCMKAMDYFLTWDQAVVTSYIKASVTQKTDFSVASVENIGTMIKKIFGAGSDQDVDSNTSFGELGLDSLMAVEILEIIEKEFHLVLNPEDIRQMSINSLQEKLRSHTSKSELENSPEENRVYGIRIRTRLEALQPLDALVPLNPVLASKGTSSVYFCHPIDGVADNLYYLGAVLGLPAYCFQCTADADSSSISSLAEFYIKEMRFIQPEGPYHIVGYSFGVAVAIEMVLQLEVEDPHLVGSLVLLDGTPHAFRMYMDKMKDRHGIPQTFLKDEEALIQVELLGRCAAAFVDLDYSSVIKELFSCASWDDRVEHFVSAVNAARSPPIDTGILKFAAHHLRQRVLAVSQYPSMDKKKVVTDATLVRAENGIIDIAEGGEDYRLKEYIEGNLNIRVVPGDHDSFIHETSALAVAATIQEIVQKK